MKKLRIDPFSCLLGMMVSPIVSGLLSCASLPWKPNHNIELDMDDGSLWNDFERSQAYRAETFDFVRLCLGLSSGECWKDGKPSSIIIRNFDMIGMAIRNVYNIGG